MDLEMIETQRTTLESNMSKLRQSLQHWQAWEAAYEDLREEIGLLPANIALRDVKNLVTGLENKLLTEKEVRDVFGLDRDTIRSTEQVMSLLSRRIEYVRENVASLQRQLGKIEESGRVNGEQRVGNGEARDEEGLPVTEIFEELDEDGNSVSGRVSHPAENAEEVIDLLRRAGVENAGENGSGNGASDAARAQSGEQIASSQNVQRSSQARAESGEESSPVQVAEATTSIEQSPRSLPTRSVSFAEGTKEKSEEEKPFSTRLTSKGLRKPNPAPNVTQALPSDSRVWEVDENDKPVNFTSPHIPVDESPEDARLRREMLQYSMAEVGAIVAELELEEGDESDGSFSDDDDDVEDDALSRSSNDSEEDIHGMSRRSHLTDEYRDEMLELEKKLNAQMVQNVGPRPDAHEIRSQVHVPPSPSNSRERTDADEAIRRDQMSAVKEVRFADDLDIANGQRKSAAKKTSSSDETSQSPPDAVKNSIIERNAPKITPQSSTPSPPPAKISKFKAARLAAAANNSNPPQPAIKPSTAPLAANIIERPVKQPKTTHEPPQEPDALDPELLKREVQADYYRQRSRLIRKQGGYKKVMDRMEHDLDDEDEDKDEGNLDDVITESSQAAGDPEPPKKVSLFKAARVDADRVWRS